MRTRTYGDVRGGACEDSAYSIVPVLSGEALGKSIPFRAALFMSGQGESCERGIVAHGVSRSFARSVSEGPRSRRLVRLQFAVCRASSLNYCSPVASSFASFPVSVPRPEIVMISHTWLSSCEVCWLLRSLRHRKRLERKGNRMLPSVQFYCNALMWVCQAFCANIFDCDRIHNVRPAVVLFRAVESRAGGRQQARQIVRR